MVVKFIIRKLVNERGQTINLVKTHTPLPSIFWRINARTKYQCKYTFMDTDMNQYLIFRYASTVVRKMTAYQLCCAGLAHSPFVLTEHICSYNWRVSEASETLIGLNNGNRRYICIYIYIFI